MKFLIHVFLMSFDVTCFYSKAHHPYQSPYQSQILVFSFVEQQVVMAPSLARHDAPPTLIRDSVRLLPHHVHNPLHTLPNALLPHHIIHRS